MTSRFSGVVLLGALCALGGGAGCGGGGGNDAGADVQGGGQDVQTADCGDAAYVQSTDDSGTSFRAMSCNGEGFCPAQVTNDPMHPSFAITQIDISAPAALHGLVNTVLNQAVETGLFFWGMTLDLSSSPGMIHTGALQGGVMPQPGTGFLTSSFQYYMGNAPTMGGGMANRWDPVSTTVTLMGDTFSSGTIDLVTVPVFAVDATSGAMTLQAELPLRNTHIDSAQMLDGRECIGLAKSTFNSMGLNSWSTSDPSHTPYGTLQGDISVDDAEHINVMLSAGATQDLCTLLAGLSGTATCATTPQAMWAHQPDTMIMGSTTPNAFHLSANFSAVAATIH